MKGIPKIKGVADFLEKAESDRLVYNLERPSFSKGGKTPWFIAQRDHPNTNLVTTVQFTSALDLRSAF